MILWELFITFLKIGVLAFGGGYAILPFIQDLVVDQQGWLNISEMTDIVIISEMTPGPIAINAATFVGAKMAGIPGSIVATGAIVLPQLIIMISLAKLYFSDREISFMTRIIKGLRPAVAGLIVIASINLIKGSVFQALPIEIKNISLVALITFILGLVLYKKKIGIIKLILIGAGLGLVLTPIIDYLI